MAKKTKKPNFLTNLTIKNFRCFEDFKLKDLKRINIFVSKVVHLSFLFHKKVFTNIIEIKTRFEIDKSKLNLKNSELKIFKN
jgi:hypothetical protein